MVILVVAALSVALQLGFGNWWLAGGALAAFVARAVLVWAEAPEDR